MNLPNQSRTVVMVGQNNRRPENEKVTDPEWVEGKKFQKTNPAEIEKLIEQIRGTNLEPGSRMRQPTEGTRMSNWTLLSISVISPRQSEVTLEVIRGSAAGPSDSMGHKYLFTTAGHPDWPIP